MPNESRGVFWFALVASFLFGARHVLQTGVFHGLSAGLLDYIGILLWLVRSFLPFVAIVVLALFTKRASLTFALIASTLVVALVWIVFFMLFGESGEYYLLVICFVILTALATGMRRILYSGEGPEAMVSYVRTKAEMLSEIQKFSSLGFIQNVTTTDTVVILAMKTTFRWPVFIALLFIPVVGWISLISAIFAGTSKVRTVRIELR